VNKIIILFLILWILLVLPTSFILSNQLFKFGLQHFITKNYHLREKHLIPDKWYWADWIYLQIYGDYSFYHSD
jgi:hypothetical protein